MVTNKSRLGRGLGALIASGTPLEKNAPVPTAPPSGALANYREVPVAQVEPNPYQPRKKINPEVLTELVQSICAEGLLQPIVVRPVGEKFQLIAGERRWRAFQQLKLKAIPARVMISSDASSATLAMIENLQRAGLSSLEEAHGYASLIRDFDLTQEAAAQRVGRSRAAVANSLRLLSLEPELQGYLNKELLSAGHAKVLLGVESSTERLSLARRCLKEDLSVRALEALVVQKRGGAPGKRRNVPMVEATAISDIERKLTSHLGARSLLRHSPKRGLITIEYAGNDDLQRILYKLGVVL